MLEPPPYSAEDEIVDMCEDCGDEWTKVTRCDCPDDHTKELILKKELPPSYINNDLLNKEYINCLETFLNENDVEEYDVWARTMPEKYYMNILEKYTVDTIWKNYGLDEGNDDRYYKSHWSAMLDRHLGRNDWSFDLG